MVIRRWPKWGEVQPALKMGAVAVLATSSVAMIPATSSLRAQDAPTSSALCGQVRSDRSRLECYDLVAACRIMTDGRERLTCYDRMNNPSVPQADLYEGSDLAASEPDQNQLPPAVQQAPFLRSSAPDYLSAGPANSRQPSQTQPSQTQPSQTQSVPSQSVAEYGRDHSLFGGVTQSGALQAVITEVRQDSRSRQLYFKFENGQTWKQVDEKRIDPVPDQGDLATITPSSFGSYIMTVDGRRFSVKIRRIS